MDQTALFIDGENFINKIEDVLESRNIRKNQIDLTTLNFSKLFEKPLQDFECGIK